MSEADHVEQAGPAEFRDPIVRTELKRASVWIGLTLAVLALIVLAQPLLLILGGIVFASMLDGGTRLLGRVLPIGRGLRLTIVSLAAIAFIVGTVWLAGVQLSAQAAAFSATVTAQANRILAWAGTHGFTPGDVQIDQLSQQLMGGLGRLTSAVSSAIGAMTSLVMIMVIGVFIAVEPRLYDRGIAWMLPLRHRAGFYRVAEHAGFTLRRLLFGRLVAMIFEGVFTWFMLWIGGVPLPGLLGLVTGVLAFIPNIGALASGVLMIAVGFSASYGHGIWCIVVYFLVHNIDAYVVVPFVARRTVDLAPAVLLAMQLLMAALFGILGVLFADPILATLRVVLVDLSRQQAAREEEGPEGSADPRG